MGKSHKHNKSKKKHKHKERREKKKLKKHAKEEKKILEQAKSAVANNSQMGGSDDGDFAIPVDLMNSKSHAPETPEEYQKRQSRIRKEVDPSTGRKRLIKGDGEVLEEIVSKEMHKAINNEATRGDGAYFEETVFSNVSEQK